MRVEVAIGAIVYEMLVPASDVESLRASPMVKLTGDHDVFGDGHFLHNFVEAAHVETVAQSPARA